MADRSRKEHRIMPDTFAEWAFLVGLIIYYTLFTVDRWRNRRAGARDVRLSVWESAFMLLAFVGDTVLPLMAILGHRLDFAAYHLPPWLGVLGVLLWAAALVVIWRAHVDLGKNWSPYAKITQEHTLVTGGIYGVIRHPIYAARWLWAIAQVLLVQNWIGGLANGLCFLPAYLSRVPREEKMMLDHFGEQYHAYMQRVGGIWPRWRR
jgi:protein-S-isoprenylcysteine O-methyltransferase Ste14